MLGAAASIILHKRIDEIHNEASPISPVRTRVQLSKA
jgi:hypothetical protein